MTGLQVCYTGTCNTLIDPPVLSQATSRGGRVGATRPKEPPDPPLALESQRTRLHNTGLNFFDCLSLPLKALLAMSSPLTMEVEAKMKVRSEVNVYGVSYRLCGCTVFVCRDVKSVVMDI